MENSQTHNVDKSASKSQTTLNSKHMPQIDELKDESKLMQSSMFEAQNKHPTAKQQEHSNGVEQNNDLNKDNQHNQTPHQKSVEEQDQNEKLLHSLDVQVQLTTPHPNQEQQKQVIHLENQASKQNHNEIVDRYHGGEEGNLTKELNDILDSSRVQGEHNQEQLQEQEQETEQVLDERMPQEEAEPILHVHTQGNDDQQANNQSGVTVVREELVKHDQPSERDQVLDLILKYTKAHDESHNDIERTILDGTLQKMQSKLKSLDSIINLKSQKAAPTTRKTLTPSEQIRQNLQEVYIFYARQSFMNGRSVTFEKLQHITNVLSLGKFMYFCRDFLIIDLAIDVSQIMKIMELQGVEATQINSPNLKRQSKFLQPRKCILDKFTLVEFFKKGSANGIEMTFNEFELCLSRIATFAYQGTLDQVEVPESSVKPNALIIFLLYLQVQKPSEYRKKMMIVGVPFAMKDRKVEKVTQEKLKRKPPQQALDTSVVSIKRDITLIKQDDNEFLEPTPIPTKKAGPVEWVTWDHLSQVKGINIDSFDPRDLLQDTDLDDLEDQIYLQEYNVNPPINEVVQHESPKKLKVLAHNEKQSSQKLSTHNFYIQQVTAPIDQYRLGTPGGQRYGQLKLNISQDRTQITRAPYKGDLTRTRGVSAHRNPQLLGLEAQARAQKFEMQELQRQKDIYQSLLKNQDQKQKKMIRKS